MWTIPTVIEAYGCLRSPFHLIFVTSHQDLESESGVKPSAKVREPGVPLSIGAKHPVKSQNKKQKIGGKGPTYVCTKVMSS